MFCTTGEVQVDAVGAAVYTVGDTQSTDFPTTPGALQTTLQPYPASGFVTKLAPGGGSLAYSTLLRSVLRSSGSVAVDGDGNASVAGVSLATVSGEEDAVVATLNASVEPRLEADARTGHLGGAQHCRPPAWP